MLIFGLIGSLMWGVRSESLLRLWVSIELNFLLFLGVLVSLNLRAYLLSRMKYFLIQSLGSAFLLWGVFLIDRLKGAVEVGEIVCLLSLLWKLGAFPFHR